MKFPLIRMLAFLALLAGPAAASAQVCAGRPGTEVGGLQLSGTFAATQGASEFGVSGGGVGNSAFGQLSVGSTSYDDFAGSTLTLGAGVGYRVQLGDSGNAELCPVIGGFIGMGPNDIEGSGFDASTRGVSAGVRIGYRITAGNDFSLIPSVGFGFAHSSSKLDDGVDSLEESDSYGSLNVGVGLVLGRQVTIRPQVTVPVGLQEADPVIGVALTLSLGASHP